MTNELHDVEAKMDPAALYREEVFTDRRVGTIRVLTPAGMLPISFELEGRSLAEAIERFGDGVKQAVEQTLREIQQLRREAASSIVIPDVRGGGLGAPGVPPRGGIIQRP